MNENEFIFAEKYRPKALDDVILPDRLLKVFKEYEKDGDLPNMLFYGSAGTGKTTTALALLNDIDAEYMVINGSTIGIDDLRSKITDFARTISMNGKRKYVLINEADGLTPRFQDALREFIEECSEYVGFILTCNYKYKIIEPILSRFSEFNFNIQDKIERKKSKIKFFVRLLKILDNEKIKYEKPIISTVIENFYPDFRKVLSEIQSYAKNGVIDEGILSLINNTEYQELITILKNKNFDGMIEWTNKHSDIDTGNYYKGILENFLKCVENPNDKAQLILIVADGQVDESRAANLDINRLAVLIKIAMDVTFK